MELIKTTSAVKAWLFYRFGGVCRLAAPRFVVLCALLCLCGCRTGDPHSSKPSKAELINSKVDKLFNLGFGLVRVDRLNVEGTAVVAATQGRNRADDVGQQAADLGFGYATSYVNSLREIRKLPRTAVEAAASARYAADPSAASNRLVYPVLKRHLNSTYLGLNLDPADVMQDYASVRYMTPTGPVSP